MKLHPLLLFLLLCYTVQGMELMPQSPESDEIDHKQFENFENVLSRVVRYLSIDKKQEQVHPKARLFMYTAKHKLHFPEHELTTAGIKDIQALREKSEIFLKTHWFSTQFLGISVREPEGCDIAYWDNFRNTIRPDSWGWISNVAWDNIQKTKTPPTTPKNATH